MYGRGLLRLRAAGALPAFETSWSSSPTALGSAVGCRGWLPALCIGRLRMPGFVGVMPADRYGGPATERLKATTLSRMM